MTFLILLVLLLPVVMVWAFWQVMKLTVLGLAWVMIAVVELWDR